jgi:hypothetical protein
VINSEKLPADTVTAARNIEKQNMAIAMESTCPIERIVATIPDAIPRWCFSAELMMAFVFGEEKGAYPRPSQSRVPVMRAETLKVKEIQTQKAHRSLKNKVCHAG